MAKLQGPRVIHALLGETIQVWFISLALVVKISFPILQWPSLMGYPRYFRDINSTATGALVGLVDEEIRQISLEPGASIRDSCYVQNLWSLAMPRLAYFH